MAEDQGAEGVAVSEIPAFLEMQAHCGMSGIILSLVWFYLAHRYKIINLLSFRESEVYLLGSIIALFGLPVYPIGVVARKALHSGGIRLARNLLRICGISCVLACTLLLWFTGGASSPFISLFIMTYTLTLSKVRTAKGPIVVPLFFLLSLAVASGYSKMRPAFSEQVMSQISSSDLYYYALLIGAVFSVIIPAVSMFVLRHKKH